MRTFCVQNTLHVLNALQRSCWSQNGPYFDECRKAFSSDGDSCEKLPDKRYRSFFFTISNVRKWGTRWRSWLRHSAISQKVAGSIPDGITGIFQLRNPSGRTMALGLTQLLTEMSTRNICWWVKAVGA